MTTAISDQIMLYGTDEPVEPMTRLTAGPVSCDFDQGALRFIKVHGKEAIRNIAFVVRDKDWGTYLPVLSNVTVKQETDSFAVTFDAVCKDEQQEIHYKATIAGAADGTLTFTGEYKAITDFLTNRTGFVVLHPIAGVAGHPVTVEHVDGKIEASEFPELVDPVQPFQDIRALTHSVLPGVSVCCRMMGDTFEMEDHRQWNDASYKTYVRPIGLPWPYTIAASESVVQSVTLTIEDSREITSADVTATDTQHCIVTVGKAADPQTMPRIGLGLEPQHLAGAIAHQKLLESLAPQQLVLWYELDKHDRNTIERAASIARSTNRTIELQAVIPDKNFKKEIATLARQCRNADIPLCAIHVAPAMYLRSIMPGTSWPDVTPLAEIYDEVRKQFPGIPTGGGMLSFFPELNRHQPPTEHLDFVSHASNTITHACDDVTVNENLEAIPYIIKTCRSFAGSKPYHVGPSSIGMRFNPYGSRTMDNPDNSRIAMARMDPRQRGLLNAAWTTGYVAHMARGGIDCINLHALTGEFGVVNHPQEWARPGFDDSSRLVYPVYHVMAGFIKASGQTQLSTHSTMSREVESVAYEDDGKHIVWIANLTQDSQTVEIKGLNTNAGTLASLSLDTFDSCTQSSEGFEQTTTDVHLPLLKLGPYSVVRLSTPDTSDFS